MHMHNGGQSLVTVLNYCNFIVFFIIGSKPNPKPKREKTEEEKTFRRRAKYFLATQLFAIVLFLSVMGGYDISEVELDDDEDIGFD